MRVFVTGASGFVGRSLVNQLINEGHHVIAAVRAQVGDLPITVEQKVIKDLSQLNPESNVFEHLNVDVVIHAAGRAHIMKEHAADPLAEFRKVNIHATVELAKQAAHAGVKRFIYLSSIKVNGESTDKRAAFSELDDPQPEDAYGQSKYEAEKALFDLKTAAPIEIVIIRPPLIYGPNVKGNFASMIRLVKKGLPLPFGSVHNQRSMIAIDNLINFISLVMTHPAANQVFLVADGEDISTTALLKKIAFAYQRPSRLMPIPTPWLKFVATLIGKKQMTDRLFGNLQIDISKARDQLGWQPVISMDQQLKKMADFDKNSATQTRIGQNR